MPLAFLLYNLSGAAVPTHHLSSKTCMYILLKEATSTYIYKYQNKTKQYVMHLGLFMFLLYVAALRSNRRYVLALYNWREPTLSLRADPNLTYPRFRQCFYCFLHRFLLRSPLDLRYAGKLSARRALTSQTATCFYCVPTRHLVARMLKP